MVYPFFDWCIIENASQKGDYMKEKRLERIELFYDLVYVFAMSKLTTLINTPMDGIVEGRLFLRYWILIFLILQSWLFMTNYSNKYGLTAVHEKIVMVIQMITMLFIGGKVSVDWNHMYTAFHISMFVNIATMVYLYRNRLKYTKYKKAARQSMIVLGTVSFIYIVALFFIFAHIQIPVLGLDVLAFLIGAWGPVLLPGQPYKKMVLFPYVLNRFQFLTMFTFATGIAAIAPFFDIDQFSVVPVLAFGVVFFLFGCYAVQMYELVEHQSTKRGVLLIVSHFLIIVSTHLLVVSLRLVHDGTMALDYLSYLIVISLAVYFLALMANWIYYKKAVHFRSRDVVQMLVFDAIGIVCILIFNYSVFGVLIGMFITSGGSYYVLKRTQFLIQFQ